MNNRICPRVSGECPNGTELNDAALGLSLRHAYEDGITIAELAEALKRHKCTIRHAIVSAGGTIRPGGHPRHI